MSGNPRRRRALLLLALALATGGLAASQVRGTIERVEARAGRELPVLVARRDLAPGDRVRAEDVVLRAVPARYAPRDALRSPGAAVGGRLVGPLAADAYLTAGLLAGGAEGPDGSLRRGERAVELAVAGGGALAAGAAPGGRVDVLVSTETRSATGRTLLAIEDAELLALRSEGTTQGPGGEGGAAAQADATATLRVSLRQAVYLTAAQNFGREIRLLARPPGERRRGPAAVSAGDL